MARLKSNLPLGLLDLFKLFTKPKGEPVNYRITLEIKGTCSKYLALLLRLRLESPTVEKSTRAAEGYLGIILIAITTSDQSISR